MLAKDLAVDCSKSHLFHMDNLSGHHDKTFKQKMLVKCRGKLHFYPPDCTSELQGMDAGVGAIAKKYMGELLDAGLEDDKNLEEWSSGLLPAWERRVLMTKCLVRHDRNSVVMLLLTECSTRLVPY